MNLSDALCVCTRYVHHLYVQYNCQHYIIIIIIIIVERWTQEVTPLCPDLQFRDVALPYSLFYCLLLVSLFTFFYTVEKYFTHKMFLYLCIN